MTPAPAGIKGKIDELLVKLPEPAQAKLADLEKSTGQPKSLIARRRGFSPLLFLFLCAFPRVRPQLVFSAVGVAYPMYASLLMLAEDTTEDAAMWITYWCTFTCFKIVMGPLDFILSFLPFYFYLKLTLLVWLFSPTTKGAAMVYEKGVAAVFLLPGRMRPPSAMGSGLMRR
ncbi:hypothetical protein JL721_6155 [Aureococcus anophagefferens]|nr:hypothetical protein JL721_6155 [Aureococcus anophagefferens]